MGGGAGREGGGAFAGGSSLFESLLAVLLSDRLGTKLTPAGTADPQMQAYRDRVRSSVVGSLEGKGGDGG
ncbi:MAG TPA: hypothetical protein VIV57_03390 [Anaeromyxobacter sp.]